MTAQKAGPEKAKDKRTTTETDLANQKMGRNRLQGDDQESVRNERHAVPDVKQEPDEVMESFTKMDKDKRARADLGKGNRKGG